MIGVSTPCAKRSESDSVSYLVSTQLGRALGGWWQPSLGTLGDQD
ncbi:hypothetical protein SLEP1_g1273 [Rubroshorea leprosula]|uniref:Uncharacterized protein n=1 Tax=Rubroshorea leprosula TaxID=152421 RepID=A0AAV5HMV4_9ROSI|nr:hypothetical protein SLEP1_g1273 [Rubroshorea leprosula]